MHVIACVRVTMVATESNCGKTNICDEHIPALVTDLHMCWILRNILQDVRRTARIVQSELSVKCRPDWHTQWVGQAFNWYTDLSPCHESQWMRVSEDAFKNTMRWRQQRNSIAVSYTAPVLSIARQTTNDSNRGGRATRLASPR